MFIQIRLWIGEILLGMALSIAGNLWSTKSLELFEAMLLQMQSEIKT